MAMFCFVLPLDEEDRRIYEMLRPGTLKSVLYTSQWIINSHIFKAELFLYVSYEAKHYGMLSLDVVIVRAGILKDHATARYIIKYIPCVDKTIDEMYSNEINNSCFFFCSFCQFVAAFSFFSIFSRQSPLSMLAAISRHLVFLDWWLPKPT